MVGRDVIGLIPAAGTASRLGGLPFSKEVLPIGWEDGRPRLAARDLLDALAAAGVEHAVVVLRHGKWDVPAAYGSLPESGTSGPHLAYLVIDSTAGVPQTVDAAYPFVRGRRVAFGFPDILFRPRDAFVRLLDRQDATGADVVLGLFATPDAQRSDMVRVAADGRVAAIEVKPARSELRLAWALAVWGPRFGDFLHARLATSGGDRDDGGEPQLGRVFATAAEADLTVQSVVFAQGRFVDVGTPDGLRRATESS